MIFKKKSLIQTCIIILKDKLKDKYFRSLHIFIITVSLIYLFLGIFAIWTWFIPFITVPTLTYGIIIIHEYGKQLERIRKKNENEDWAAKITDMLLR